MYYAAFVCRALARTGNAYLQKDDLQNALNFLNKSISENRDPAVVKKVIEVQKTIKAREASAYINPELALEEKQKGNKFFTEGMVLVYGIIIVMFKASHIEFDVSSLRVYCEGIIVTR